MADKLTDTVLGQRLLGFLDSAEDLREARRNVPDYTGQYSSEDFVQAESDAYDKAVASLGAALRALVREEIARSRE